MYKFNESSEYPVQNLALNRVYVDPFWPTNSSLENTLTFKINPHKLKLSPTEFEVVKFLSQEFNAKIVFIDCFQLNTSFDLIVNHF